jgi:C-1 hydroxylase
MPSLEGNKAVVRRYLEGWQVGSATLLDEVLHPSFIDYMAGQPRTKEALLRQALNPDIRDRRVDIDDIIAIEDKVVVRYTMHVLHAPTGKEASYTGIFIARVVDGKMVEGWGERDQLGQMRQLGITLAPTPHSA